MPQMPSNLFHNVPGGVKLHHINIRNFKRKMEDMKNDDIFSKCRHHSIEWNPFMT